MVKLNASSHFLMVVWWTLNVIVAQFNVFYYLNVLHEDMNAHNFPRLHSRCLHSWIFIVADNMYCHQLHPSYKYDIYYGMLWLQYCFCWIHAASNASHAILHRVYKCWHVHFYAEYLDNLLINDYSHHNVVCDTISPGNLLLNQRVEILRTLDT